MVVIVMSVLLLDQYSTQHMGTICKFKSTHTYLKPWRCLKNPYSLKSNVLGENGPCHLSFSTRTCSSGVVEDTWRSRDWFPVYSINRVCPSRWSICLFSDWTGLGFAHLSFLSPFSFNTMIIIASFSSVYMWVKWPYKSRNSGSNSSFDPEYGFVSPSVRINLAQCISVCVY